MYVYTLYVNLNTCTDVCMYVVPVWMTFSETSRIKPTASASWTLSSHLTKSVESDKNSDIELQSEVSEKNMTWQFSISTIRTRKCGVEIFRIFHCALILLLIGLWTNECQAEYFSSTDSVQVLAVAEKDLLQWYQDFIAAQRADFSLYRKFVNLIFCRSPGSFYEFTLFNLHLFQFHKTNQGRAWSGYGGSGIVLWQPHKCIQVNQTDCCRLGANNGIYTKPSTPARWESINRLPRHPVEKC